MSLDDESVIDPRAMLGGFTSDLWFPTYRPGNCGAWSIQVIAMIAARGYWGATYQVGGSIILKGPSDGADAAWMSITPMEVESQEIGLAAAHGHTIVLGLGMGWLAANAALNPAVERVTVVERDPDVIALIETLGIFRQLPDDARAKLRIVQADALRWRPDEPVDSVQADIWEKFVEPQKWDDVQRMQDNIRASALYFWGQEMELWRLACRADNGPPARFDGSRIATIVEQTGLPLICPDWPDYGDRIAAAARWWAPSNDGWWNDFRGD